MKRIIPAVLFTALSGVSGAQAFDTSGLVVVPDPQNCPPHTTANANYKWQDGRFVRDGWACHTRVSPL
jgi:hypothetical protein